MSGGGDDERQTHTAAVVCDDGECGEEFRAMGRDSLSGRECERTSGRAGERAAQACPGSQRWNGRGQSTASQPLHPTSSVELTLSLWSPPFLPWKSERAPVSERCSRRRVPVQPAASSAAAKPSSRKAAISTQISDFKSLLALHTLDQTSAAQPTKFERRLRLIPPLSLSRVCRIHSRRALSLPRMQMTSHSFQLSQLELARAARARAPALAVPRPGPHTLKL